MRATGVLRRWRDETGDAGALRVVRIVVGVLLLDRALGGFEALSHGYFGDSFHWPILPESLVLPRGAYEGLVAAQLVAAAIVIAGLAGWARLALLASSLAGVYVILCDRIGFHHNRWALDCYAFLLAFTPCDRPLAPGPAPAPARGPLWAARLAGVQVSLVYLASGGSKLVDPDWRSGRVLFERLVLAAPSMREHAPAWLVDRLVQPEVGGALAALAIATELFLAVGLWLPRTRAFALWWGACFHLTIEATSRVEAFSWLTLAAYGFFVTPDTRARRFAYDPSSPRARRLARVTSALDWLARFDVTPQAPGEASPSSVVVVDRDGTRATGLGALAVVARCTPLLFPLWLPIAAAALSSRASARPAR